MGGIIGKLNFDRDVQISHATDEHGSGRRDHAHRLWSVLMLELWFREFIDGDAAAEPSEDAVLVRAA